MDEVGAFAQDARGRDLSRGASVEIVAGEDAGTRGHVQDVSAGHVVVALPDGSSLRTLVENVQMSTIFGMVVCPYCDKTVTVSAYSHLGDHRVVGGVCDGSGRAVARLDGRRAVLAS